MKTINILMKLAYKYMVNIMYAIIAIFASIAINNANKTIDFVFTMVQDGVSTSIPIMKYTEPTLVLFLVIITILSMIMTFYADDILKSIDNFMLKCSKRIF